MSPVPMAPPRHADDIGGIQFLPVAGADAVAGLTSDEAARLREQHGANAGEERAARPGAMLLHLLSGPIPWMLEAAIVLDIVLGRWLEAAVIAVLLAVNTLMGLMQQRRSMMAMGLLERRLSVLARVKRDGRWQQIEASQLVPGDAIHLRVGDVVPADVQLLGGQLLVDESVLTGESLPAEKLTGATAFSGSTIQRGEAGARVTAIGGQTQLGRTASLVRIAQAPPRLQGVVVGVAKYLAGFDIVLAAVVLAVSVARGVPLQEVLPFVLMLLIFSIPHVLPTMFTVSAAMGARMLAERGILVTRLAAIEDAATMDVLCLDKTGTLTENRLSVGSVAPFVGFTADDVLRLATMASEKATQDPIDLAVLDAADRQALAPAPGTRVAFVPFEPSLKRSEATWQDGGGAVRVVKGEPLTLAEMAGAEAKAVMDEVDALAADGARVIGVASASGGAGLQLAGLIALGDPPRADSAAAIAALNRRGVRTVLVTGDGPATAMAIASQVGISGELAPPGTIHERMTPDDAARYAVYARVLPQDKFFLVRTLQQSGHVVGMTGDGVNDAAALRQADVGVAVANATDVAKAAASIVLTTPGIGGITMAVEGSRKIYQRIKSFLVAMNTRKLALPVILSLGVIFLGSFVLSPLMLALFMLSADFVTMSVAMDQTTPSPGPDRWDLGPLMHVSLALGAILVACTTALYWWATQVAQLNAGQTQTVLFVWLVFAASQGVVYVARARGQLWAAPLPARMVNLVALANIAAVSSMALLGWLMAPVSSLWIGGVLLAAALFVGGANAIKGLLVSTSPPRIAPVSAAA